MDMNREQLLKEVMAADFTVIDLHLYLDTHPCDSRALAIYNSAVQRSNMLRIQFERLYGPLTPMTPNLGNKWRWIEDPWPWERGI
ncbi:MAG: spore coat protein CotJB [Clostridia bacterium]|nr:spore coat protein CotJB [Clostridia bacterium]